METLLFTYGIAAAAVGTYATWLVIGNLRLASRISDLEAHDYQAPRPRQAA
jgi:hypothetical protein